MKASTSSGVGGRPVTSKVTRRMSSRRPAGFDGARPCWLSFARMKRSMFDCGLPSEAGVVVCRGCKDHHWGPARRSPTLSPQVAPDSIQRLSVSFSAADSGPAGGIWLRTTRCKSRLSAGFAVLRTGPWRPPLSAAVREERSRPATLRDAPWQLRQRVERMSPASRFRSAPGSAAPQTTIHTTNNAERVTILRPVYPGLRMEI